MRADSAFSCQRTSPVRRRNPRESLLRTGRSVLLAALCAVVVSACGGGGRVAEPASSAPTTPALSLDEQPWRLIKDERVRRELKKDEYLLHVLRSDGTAVEAATVEPILVDPRSGEMRDRATFRCRAELLGRASWLVTLEYHPPKEVLDFTVLELRAIVELPNGNHRVEVLSAEGGEHVVFVEDDQMVTVLLSGRYDASDEFFVQLEPRDGRIDGVDGPWSKLTQARGGDQVRFEGLPRGREYLLHTYLMVLGRPMEISECGHQVRGGDVVDERVAIHHATLDLSPVPTSLSWATLARWDGEWATHIAFNALGQVERPDGSNPRINLRLPRGVYYLQTLGTVESPATPLIVPHDQVARAAWRPLNALEVVAPAQLDGAALRIGDKLIRVGSQELAHAAIARRALGSLKPRPPPTPAELRQFEAASNREDSPYHRRGLEVWRVRFAQVRYRGGGGRFAVPTNKLGNRVQVEVVRGDEVLKLEVSRAELEALLKENGLRYSRR